MAASSDLPPTFQPEKLESQVLSHMFGVPASDPSETSNSVTCHKCKRHVSKDNAHEVGSGKKKSWKCRSCNSLQCRITRVLAHGGGLATDWAQLSPEESQKFFHDFGELQGSHLGEQMRASVKFSSYGRTVAFAGAKGKFFPLAVYEAPAKAAQTKSRTGTHPTLASQHAVLQGKPQRQPQKHPRRPRQAKGYNADQLKNIEKNAQKKHDSTLNDWVYCLEIDELGHRGEDIMQSERTFQKKAEEAAVKPAKRQRRGSAPEDGSEITPAEKKPKVGCVSKQPGHG